MEQLRPGGNRDGRLGKVAPQAKAQASELLHSNPMYDSWTKGVARNEKAHSPV
jgi:hypothetical protein